MIQWNAIVPLRMFTGTLIFFVGVSCQQQSDTVPGQPVLDEKTLQDELQAYLTEPHLLNRLGVESLKVLESHGDWVTVGTDKSDVPIGEVYYTIQNGWYLKADNVHMEHVPGKGWSIAEQD